LIFFWKLCEHPEEQTIELPGANITCLGLTNKKYHGYIFLSLSQYDDSWHIDIVTLLVYKLFPEKFLKQKNYL
jgi:hypothetical protein